MATRRGWIRRLRCAPDAGMSFEVISEESSDTDLIDQGSIGNKCVGTPIKLPVKTKTYGLFDTAAQRT